jgi:hypothetical protein
VFGFNPFPRASCVLHNPWVRGSLVPVVLVVSALGFGGACTPEPKPDGDAGPDGPTCAAPFVGALRIDGVEDEPGYDDALGALDLAALPASLPLGGLSALEAELVRFMLEQEEGDAVDRDAALAAGPLGAAVLGAFARAGAPGGIDFTFLRQGLFRFYGCARAFPATLEAYREQVWDFRAEPEDEIVASEVKGLRRRIWRSAVHSSFIAETLREDDSVRETEIILTDRRADGDLDFVEYDEDGRLRGASEFAASGGGETVGAVPFSCIACHGFRDVVPAAQ